MKTKLLILLFLIFSMPSVGAKNSEQNDVLEFQSSEQETRYYKVITQLRCPKCENQAISDSDADIAKDLRYVVYQKIIAGDSSQEVMRYMQNRYGDFVLYDPPVKPINYVLWFMPVLVFLIIFIVVIAKVGRRKPLGED